MDVTNSTTNATHTVATSGVSFNRLFFRLLVFLLSSSAFWVAISVAVLIHFVLEYVFRPKKNNSQPLFNPEVDNVCDKDRFTGLDYLWDHTHDTFWNNASEYHDVTVPKSTDELADVDFMHGDRSNDYENSEKSTSSLSLKLEHHTLQEYSIKEDKSLGFDELPVSEDSSILDESSRTSIQKYQFVPERNLRGFVLQPETMTISVNEISNELKTEKFASKEERQNINREEEKIGEIQNLEQVWENTKSDIMQKFESESRGTETQFLPKTEVQMAMKHDSLPEFEPECEPEQVVQMKSEPKPNPEQEFEQPNPKQEFEQPNPEQEFEQPNPKQEFEQPNPEQEFEHVPEPEDELQPEHEPEPELEPEQEPEPELEQQHELKLEPESEPIPEQEQEQECELKHEPESEPKPKKEQQQEHEQEQDPEPEPDPELEHGLKPELQDVVRCDIDAKSEREFSESSDKESWSESKPEKTYYKETKKHTNLSADIASSNNDVITGSVITSSERGSFNPINEPTEFENIPSDTEIPLEMPKRVRSKQSPVRNRRKQVRKKRSVQKEMLSAKTKLSSSSSPSTISSNEKGRRMLSRRHTSGEFSGFDSDSQSSVSDGYSVKDLVVDSDNDWFSSEKETDKSPHKTQCTEESTNLVRYTSQLMHLKELEKSQAQFFYGSETDSSNTVVQISDHPNQLDEVVDTWLENNSKPELDVSIHEEKDETKVSNGSEGVKFKEITGLNERHIETNESFAELATKEDSNKETLTIVLSQEDEATIGSVDREANMDTSEQYATVSPRKDSAIDVDRESDTDDSKPYETASLRKDFATDIPTQDSMKTDVNQNKAKEKCSEYLDEEEEDELESLWEHQDLIEQLKMEIKKARAIGLPTILEESETPKTTIEELKAWHFNEKFLREDPMDELNKFYKSYRERMRKFDILNYQKMYAVGFLQLKDPLESMGSQKPLLPTITSILTQNLYKRRKSTDDPSERFIKELRCDLETVYVGQICLSWEFLRWQYEKALEMPELDPYHSHRYSQAAGEFQQFQVLVNRFVENEPFQGPRLPNYVKTRCVLRNLLQVPVIKEDNLKEKSDDDQKGNYIITSEQLEDIMEESIRVFWEFIKADKDETPVLMKGLVGPQAELQNPSDYTFMMRLHSVLQKKDKRLKDLLKTGNCLIKKFKKPKEDRSNQDLFFSQVDIKLVSRVLKLPKITSEQLQWCREKLEKISFVGRKVKRESSFLLFPC